MGDLADGVDAGIGPSGAMHDDALAAEAQDRRLQHLLHGEAVLLALPADEAAPSYSTVSL